MEELVGLFDQLRDRLLRYVISLGLPVRDGEDIIQEEFLSLFRHLQQGRSRSNLQAWTFRVAENNRPISMAERLSANAAYHFSFVRNCLRWAQEPLVYVNPCGPEALALISDQRGATNNPPRSAESQSRSSARAGRDWAGYADHTDGIGRQLSSWRFPNTLDACLR